VLGVIAEVRLILSGRYPDAEQWRPLVATAHDDRRCSAASRYRPVLAAAGSIAAMGRGADAGVLRADVRWRARPDLRRDRRAGAAFRSR
jgi:hypothetical protein